MKAGKWIGIGLLITMGTVVAGLAALWLVSGFGFWRMPVMTAPGNRGLFQNIFACDGSGYGMGSGMMGGRGQTAQCEGDTPVSMMGDDSPIDSLNGESLSLDDVHKILDQYLVNMNDDGLEIAEVMEFENNFYAIIREEETGLGAMELLVDKWRGTVTPEIGPNMMWNTKYGMHGRGMMGRRDTGENELPEESALRIAQVWLDENYLGVSTDGHADPFYGYYTIHTLKDGVIEGMLSVHDTTGQVWYHTWHGDFVQMVEGEDTH